MKTISFPRLALALFLVLLLPGAASAQFVINEVLADNNTAFNVDGEYPDFVEIYNASGSPANLSGWRLTDDVTKPSLFIFPANEYTTNVPPGGFVLVICDGLTNDPGVHAALGFSDKGEGAFLYSPGPVLRDSVTFGFQVTDRSIGRAPNGTGPFLLCRPTPEGPNATVPLGVRQNIQIN